jgi:hypothetical protein
MPDRAFLIALGLRLNMNLDKLNHMLVDLAGMGPMCPKDRVESAIIFLLEELNCNFPSFFYSPDEGVGAAVFELRDYSSETARDADDVPAILLDHEDNPVEDLHEYVYRIMKEHEEESFIANANNDYFAEVMSNLQSIQ